MPLTVRLLLGMRQPAKPVPIALSTSARLRWHENVLADHLLQPAAILAASYILHRANAAGEGWPALRTIAEEVGVSERTAERAVAQLRDRGWLMCARRGRGLSNRYVLSADADLEASVRELIQARRDRRTQERELKNDPPRMAGQKHAAESVAPLGGGSRTDTDGGSRSATGDGETLLYESMESNPSGIRAG